MHFGLALRAQVPRTACAHMRRRRPGAYSAVPPLGREDLRVCLHMHRFPARTMAAVPNGGATGTSDEPSSHAPVLAFPDFRLFDSAQDILDHNKRIIKEIKSNHEAQTAEALARNCVLIRELNTNIAAVMRAYSSISESFERYMQQNQRSLQGSQQQLLQQHQQIMQQLAGGGEGTGNGNAASEAAVAAAVPQVPT